MKKSLLKIVTGLLTLNSEEEILNYFIENCSAYFGKIKLNYSPFSNSPADIEIKSEDKVFGYIAGKGVDKFSAEEKDEFNEAVNILGYILSTHADNVKQENNKFDFFQNLLNAIPNPVFFKGMDGKYLGCNKAFEEYLGVSAKDMIGKDVYELSSDKELADKYFEKDKELLANPGTQSYEWMAVNKQGEKRYVKFSKAIFYYPDGQQGGIIGIIDDITKTVEFEDKLKYRVEIENVLSKISARFFEESTGNIDASIEYALKLLGEFAEVDRAYVFLFDEKNNTMSNTHEWYNKNVSPSKDKFQNTSFSIFSWGVNKVLEQELLIIDDVQQLLGEIGSHKARLLKLNLKSIIIVPIIYNKKSIGFLGLNSEKQKRSWDYGDSHVLKVVSGLVSVALEKQKNLGELRESENRFKAVVEQSLTGIYIIRGSRFIYVNPKFSEIFGYKTNEIIEQCNVSDLVYEEDRELVIENLSKRLIGETDAIKYTFRGSKKDGSVINVEVHGSRSILNGQPVVVGVLLDITDRIMIENSLRKLSKAVEQSSASVMVTDRNGYIEYVNPSFAANTGFERKDVMGKNPRLLKSHTTPIEVYNDLWNTIKSGNNWRGELLNKKKSGELYWEYNSISPIKNDKGEITHFVAVKEDITDQKKMIEELQAAKVSAEKANKLKSEFLAQVSHEIRTPINILLSFSGLIWEDVKDSVSDELKNNYSMIRRAGNRIIRTIDLILNLSQIQVGSVDMTPVEIDVIDHFLENILPEYKYRSKSKGLVLEFCSDLKSAVVKSDEYMFDQIFTNLIDNAIKYTEKGRIDVVVDIDKNDNIFVDVLDTGIGISEEYLPNLFETFSQEEQGYTRRYEGTGLGLALVKNYCEMNNAEISVQSEKGSGSKFRVTFFNTKLT